MIQAGHGRLIPIRDGADVKLIGYKNASPGSYSVFDPDTLTSTTHAFADALRIDFASNSPVLDADGVTFNGARPGRGVWSPELAGGRALQPRACRRGAVLPC